MKVDVFDFDLPQDRIALEPANPRESAKLLSVNAGNLSDHIVADLPGLLRDDDLLVVNNTKVVRAHLEGSIEGKNVSFNLIERVDMQHWLALGKPGKRFIVGSVIEIAQDFQCKIIEKHDSGQILLRFDEDGLFTKLEKHGTVPLPPYITKQRDVVESDAKLYQTSYAKHEGAVAAPTAGLHLTDQLLSKLNLEIAEVTLHVGAGTFLPVKVEDTNNHIMHSEYYEIDEIAAEKINRAKQENRRIVAVGTTSLRTLEAASKNGNVEPGNARTDIFITPGYKFQMVDILLTNFHLPRSTLFMLVSAFAGLESMQDAYKHAIDNNYRFYSYGDACLLTRL